MDAGGRATSGTVAEKVGMRGYKQLILFSSPQPSPAGQGLGDLATHCFCYIEKLCRYLCPLGISIVRDSL
jgi:hypothetical protein